VCIKFFTWGVVGASVCFVKLLNICFSVYISCIEYMFFCFLHWRTNVCDDMGLDVLMLKVSNKRALGRLRANLHPSFYTHKSLTFFIINDFYL